MPSRQLALLVEPMCPTPTRGSTAWLRGRPCMPRIIGDRILLNPTPSNAPADSLRVKRSITVAKYSQPSLVGMLASSVRQAWLAIWAVKLQPRR